MARHDSTIDWPQKYCNGDRKEQTEVSAHHKKKVD